MRLNKPKGKITPENDLVFMAPEAGPPCPDCGAETWVPSKGPLFICDECEFVEWGEDEDRDPYGRGDW